MDKVVNKTVNTLTRLGERLERNLSIGEKYSEYLPEPESGLVFPSARSAFRRPLDRKSSKNNIYSSQRRGLIYGSSRKYSTDNLAASSAYITPNQYQEPRITSPYSEFSSLPPYGTDFIGSRNYNTFYGNGNYQQAQMPYGIYPGNGNIGYSPDYYVAERRQIELVPAPPPRIVREPVPVPVDRPVLQPYPIAVPTPVAVDRPVPVPVPVDRIVPVPVPVPSPPVCVPVPVPVPSPVPCYVPVGVPVASPVASPVMFEQSVTHSQRWVTGSPVMMSQSRQLAGSPVMMSQPRYLAGSPVMGMNPAVSYGNYSFFR